ncbi:MAG: nodulation protein NfeD [Acidobacteriota bacterium]
MTRLRRTTALLLTFLAGLVWAGSQADEGDAPRVLVMTLDGGVVQPVVAEFTAEVLETAASEGADAVIFELSTPGGMLDSTRQIWQEMLESPVPVVVWVTPAGAQAASAGFFLLMAGDVAAMSPGTNTGAAHPVAGGGGDIEGDLGKKIEEDSAAAIRSLAGRNGRDLRLAESAVLESRSFTAQEAIDLGLADFLASDLTSLLEKLDGLEVRSGTPEARVLRTAGASVTRAEMTPFQRVRSTLAHPEIAVLLMSLGSAGLLIELQNPGLLFPGVLGAIALILGFYGASILPLNYAGLALMGLAVVLLIAEISVQSFGILGMGGLLSFVLGSLMLFRSADPALRVSTGFIVTLAAAGALLMAGLSWLAFRARSATVATGASGMLAEAATAVAGFAPGAGGYEGRVQVHGELWRARSAGEVAAGDQLVVTGVDGLTLDVAPQTDVAEGVAER